MDQLKNIIQNIIFDASYLKMMGEPLPICAEHLAEQYKDKLLVPPVREGDTVFAVIDDIEGPYIYEWQISGVGIINGKWYVFEGTLDYFELGSQEAYATREEAETTLKALHKGEEK